MHYIISKKRNFVRGAIDAIKSIKKENKSSLWFRMWLEKRGLGISDIFSEDAVCIESWGQATTTSRKQKMRFEKWYFKDVMVNGKGEAF